MNGTGRWEGSLPDRPRRLDTIYRASFASPGADGGRCRPPHAGVAIGRRSREVKESAIYASFRSNGVADFRSGSSGFLPRRRSTNQRSTIAPERSRVGGRDRGKSSR